MRHFFSKYSLIKQSNYPFLFFANLSNAISQWLILTLIAKFYGTENLGAYALVIAFIIPLNAFFSLQLRNVYVSDQSNTYEFSSFIFLRLTSAILFLIILLVIGTLYYSSLLYIFLFLGLSKCFELLSDIIHAYFHKLQEISLYSKQLIYRSLFTICLNIIFFYYFNSFQIALLSLPIANFIILCLDVKLLTQRQVNIFKIGLIHQYKILILTGIYSGLSLFLVYMLPNIPRFFLEKFNGKFDLGIYSGYLSLIVFSRIFVQSITQISLPKLSTYFDRFEFPKFLNIIKKETIVVVLIGGLQFLIIPISNYIFPIIFNDDFINHDNFLIIIFSGSFFSFLSFVLNNALNAMKMFNIQLPIYFTSTVFALFAAYKIIPTYGLYGAGYIFSGTCFLQFLLLAITFMHTLNSKTKRFKMNII